MALHISLRFFCQTFRGWTKHALIGPMNVSSFMPNPLFCGSLVIHFFPSNFTGTKHVTRVTRVSPKCWNCFGFALFGGASLDESKMGTPSRHINFPSCVFFWQHCCSNPPPLAPSLSPASVHLPHSSRVEVSEPPKNRLSILMFVLLTWGKHIAQTITKVSCSHRGLVDIVSCDPRWPWASHDLYFSWKSKGTPPMPPTQEIRPY